MSRGMRVEFGLMSHPFKLPTNLLHQLQHARGTYSRAVQHILAESDAYVLDELNDLTILHQGHLPLVRSGSGTDFLCKC